MEVCITWRWHNNCLNFGLRLFESLKMHSPGSFALPSYLYRKLNFAFSLWEFSWIYTWHNNTKCNNIWHFAWFDWGRKFYCQMPFLIQTCWQTRKLGVFTWDTISQLDSPHISFVTYQDDNNQQGCAYFHLVAHTCQIAISQVSITQRTPQGGGVDLWVEGVCDPT